MNAGAVRKADEDDWDKNYQNGMIIFEITLIFIYILKKCAHRFDANTVEKSSCSVFDCAVRH